MSAEAPKGNQGCLLGFLRRFVNSQPPVGLENFTTKIQQGINNHHEAQRQQVLERRDATTASVLAETARKAEIAREQIEFEKKEVAAIVEAGEILNQFQIKERLRYIQATVWGGKGKIRPIGPEFGIYPTGSKYVDVDKYDQLGGFELVHEYPLFRLTEREVEIGGEAGGTDTEWKYEPKTGSTSINVVILKKIDSGKDDKILSIHSEGEIGKKKDGTFVHDPHYLTYDFSHTMDSRLGNTFDRFPGSNVLHVNIPVGLEESAALLDAALSQEANYRIVNEFLPSQLESKARRVLDVVKQKPCWLKWTRNRNDVK